MCPTHIEQVIDSKLVSSTRLSDRLALWQKYARNPINVDSVRMEFFRKVRSGKLFQKSRTLKCQRPESMRVPVPAFIKAAYQNRCSGYPIEHSTDLLKPRPRDMSQDEEEWIKGVVALQCSLADQKKVLPDKRRPPKKPRKKATKKEKGDDDSESTDSECEMDISISDEISVQVQEEIAKYLSRQGQNVSQLNASVRDFLASKKLEEIFSKDVSRALRVRARAALIPLDLKKRTPCPVAFRTFKVGQGTLVDLNLSSYGHCNYVSEFHASLFFDQYSRTFELLNYSEFGSVVDNLIYSGDVSIHPVASKMDPKMKAMSESALEKGGSNQCFCSSSAAELNLDRGCEVSAVLHHGSYVRFGCLQFVFSVLTYDDELIDEKSDEKNDS